VCDHPATTSVTNFTGPTNQRLLRHSMQPERGGHFADKTFRRQTLRRQCRTFRRHIQLHKDRISRHRHPRRNVVKCGLYAIVCVGETSDIVGVTSVGETSCRQNVRTRCSPAVCMLARDRPTHLAAARFGMPNFCATLYINAHSTLCGRC